MGKTTLIEKGLTERLHDLGLDKDILWISIDVQRMGAEIRYRDFLQAVFDGIAHAADEAGIGRDATKLRDMTIQLTQASNFRPGDRRELFDRFANVLLFIAKASKRRIVLFLDEFSEVRKVIEQARAVAAKNPSRMRDQLPHDYYLDVAFMHQLSSLLKREEVAKAFSLIVAVRPFMADYDRDRDLQLLKLMKPISVYYLDEASAKALVREPLRGKLEIADGVDDYLWRMTAGHPYLLQFLLKQLVDRAKMERQSAITLQHVQELEERMINDGPAFQAHFRLLISDYSVDSVLNAKELLHGEGVVAIASKIGNDRPDRWVSESEIVESLARHQIAREKASYLLDQLSRARILEEGNVNNTLCYRVFVPLLQKRLERHNLYLKYFR
jgi:hypothetical protein